ncbi:T7SS effector LXG polymorphic toxin [Paraliobacillus ryukyuensis]|uniref:T7SS effector LXG polymorphic toxin n=1 Tax=Paraliobacillus ryukyuensis TaxID=200904 RepID=UPI0009A584B7|nr:T7SS effector LXG polymorphic toxin [Paraliobacillus ryukyuensis]
MGHKVNLSEVIEFSDELKSTSEDLKESISQIQQNIDSLQDMVSFSGKTADEAKLYFGDCH